MFLPIHWAQVDTLMPLRLPGLPSRRLESSSTAFWSPLSRARGEVRRARAPGTRSPSAWYDGEVVVAQSDDLFQSEEWHPQSRTTD